MEARRRDITASIAGGLLGVHDYTTAFEIWGSKTGRIKEDQEDTPAMKRGRLLEPVAFQLLAEKHPDWVLTPPGVYLRDTEIRMGATPDLYVDSPDRGPGVVQVKTTADLIFKQKWRDPSTHEIVLPLWIAIQCMIETELSGRAWGEVALMVVGMGLDLYEVDVPLHASVMKRVNEAIKAFWDLTDSGEPMPPDYARDGANIARVFDQGNEPPIDLSGDNRFAELVDQRSDLKEAEKAAKAKLEEVEAEIKFKLGNSSIAICGPKTVTWKLQKRAGYQVKPTEFRVLKVA
ncbi:YqaJ viral recombinase family protein [Labrys neptuniae]